jgi:hypothetical protein
MIQERFGGDRIKAMQTYSGKLLSLLSLKNKKLFIKKHASETESFGLLFSLIQNMDKWRAKEINQLLSIIAAKAGDERNYILQFQKHGKLLAAFGALSFP